MSGYNYEVFISDFAERTLKNYEKISEMQKSGCDVYEVTQLMNSLFGLLIVPNEKYKYRNNRDGTKENTLKKTKAYKNIQNMIKSLNVNSRLYSSYDDKYEVSSFVGHLRNALAHSGNQGLHFLPLEEGNEITLVMFYDSNKDLGGKDEFCAEMSIHEICELAKNIAEMYSEIDFKNVSENINTYKNEIKKCRELLKKGELTDV